MVERRPLDGQVAIVTGAARAIGRAIAEALAARGATVVSLDLAPADDTIAAIESAGGSALAITADVTDAAAVAVTVANVLGELLGASTCSLNNAGLFAGIERRPFWEIDLKEREHALGVNVRSVFLWLA